MHCTYRKTLCFRQWASVCENNCSRHHDLVNRYGFVTRDTLRVWHVELFTLPQHLSSPLDLSGVRARSLVFYVMFCRYVFVLFLLMFVLSVLRFTSSEYLFGIFKLILLHYTSRWWRIVIAVAILESNSWWVARKRKNTRTFLKAHNKNINAIYL